MWNLVFLFTGLIFIILLLVIFLSRPKIKTKENKMFLILSVLNLIGYIIEIALQIFVRKVGNDSIFGIELSKIYIMYIFVWFSIFSIYTFLISNSSGKLSDYSYKIIKYTHITAIILGIIGIGIMPIEKYYSNGEMYTYGMSVNFLKIMLGVYIIIWIFRLLLNFRTIKEKKYYSIIITILLLFANIVFQSINPAILIATFTMTYTCYIIFFTIENPDIRMAKELAFANEQIKRKKDNIEYDKIMKIISLIDAGTEINGYKDGSNELVLSIYQKIKNPYKVLEEKEENKGIKVRYFNLSSKRILLVDDGINNIREMLLLLKPYKVSVDVAKNFDDLRKYLVSNKTYDLIFIDDVIYGVDSEEYSVEMYERLTGYNSFKTIIMLSNDKEKNISEYLGKGYVDYIIKPLNKRNINEVLKKHLK